MLHLFLGRLMFFSCFNVGPCANLGLREGHCVSLVLREGQCVSFVVRGVRCASFVLREDITLLLV